MAATGSEEGGGGVSRFERFKAWLAYPGYLDYTMTGAAIGYVVGSIVEAMR